MDQGDHLWKSDRRCYKTSSGSRTGCGYGGSYYAGSSSDSNLLILNWIFPPHGITFRQKTWSFLLVKNSVVLLYHFSICDEYYMRLEREKKKAPTFPDRGNNQSIHSLINLNI